MKTPVSKSSEITLGDLGIYEKGFPNSQLKFTNGSLYSFRRILEQMLENLKELGVDSTCKAPWAGHISCPLRFEGLSVDPLLESLRSTVRSGDRFQWGTFSLAEELLCFFSGTPSRNQSPLSRENASVLPFEEESRRPGAQEGGRTGEVQSDRAQW